MNRIHSRGVARVWAVLGALVALLATGALLRVAAQQPSQLGSQPATGAHGMLIHRDPATGRLGVPPPNFVTAPPTGPPVVERAGRTRGGGFLADLRGRGTKTMVATKDAAGNVHVDCVDGTAGE